MLWITGSKGLLGAALSEKCKELKSLQTGKEVDVGDRSSVLHFMQTHPGITHIVNCAAFSQVDAAETNREEAYRSNAIAPENLALAAKENGAKLIHISTDYVFGGDLKRPLSENDSVGPTSYYGVTKLIGEEKALDLCACVIRTSWIFGRGGKNFVSKLLQMLQSQKEIRLTDDQWGRFTYAPDLADAILQMLDSSGLYQFANSGVTTKYEFGLAMREEAIRQGYPILTEAILPVPGAAFPAPCKRPIYSAFNTTKIEALLSIRHWRHALRDFLCDQQTVYS